MTHRYELDITFVLDKNTAEDEIRTFLNAFKNVTYLNAGDNEEGPFLHGQVTNLGISRYPEGLPEVAR